MSTDTLIASPPTYRRRRTDAPGFVDRDPRSTTKYDGASRRIELWSPWGERRLPGTAGSEARFVARLRELAAAAPHQGPPTCVPRHQINALMTAIRGSVTADEALQIAPGLRPAGLLAAYDWIESRRVAATAAWAAIVEQPTLATVLECGGIAERIVPVALSHVRCFIERNPHDAQRLAAAIARIDAELASSRNEVDVLEAELDSGELPEGLAATIGDLLFDAFGEGIWSAGTFLAPRVGALVPARVATLLEEDRRAPSGDVG